MKTRKQIINRIYPIILGIDSEHPDVPKFDNYTTIEQLFKLRQFFLQDGSWGYAGMIKAVISKIGYSGLDRDAVVGTLLLLSHNDDDFLRYEKRSKEEREAHARLKQT